MPKIKADQNALGEVFFNLVNNAIEAMPDEGTLTVEVSHGQQENVLIRFSDTGKGISKENLSKIFTPFFTTKKNGTGLGLAIAAKIIALHKGNLTAEGGNGSGSTFIVSLPANKI